MSLFLWVNETPGTHTFSSEKINSSSLFVKVLITNSLSKASDVSDLIIQLFKNESPPIKTSFFAGINVSQFWFSKVSEISILKSSASLFVWL